MPSYSHCEAQIEKLVLDAEYASLYLEVSFDEALKDGFVGGFLIALGKVVEAVNRRQSEPTTADTLRQQLHHKLDSQENPTVESIISALEEVGLTHKLKPIIARVPSEGILG